MRQLDNSPILLIIIAFCFLLCVQYTRKRIKLLGSWGALFMVFHYSIVLNSPIFSKVDSKILSTVALSADSIPDSLGKTPVD